MVCLGAHFSAVWIVVANSWMQTPAGYHIVGEGMHARAEVTDFWQVVFNPSMVDRLSHTICGAWQAGAFLVVSVSAWYLLKNKFTNFARASLKVGLTVALIASLLQAVTGHMSAQGVGKNQPAKLAAFEGLYQTTSNAPLTIIGWVDEKNEQTHRHPDSRPVEFSRRTMIFTRPSPALTLLRRKIVRPSRRRFYFFTAWWRSAWR